MKHKIDPRIDCVFKAILASDGNGNLLVHFLNAMLLGELQSPIESVDILNPYNEREFIDDKLSIVDVKARDAQGAIYQIEIQLLRYTDLPTRILYTWTDLYSQQLHRGDGYHVLEPTYSIWLLGENLISNDEDYIHHFKVRDTKGNALVERSGGIWLAELEKLHTQQIDNEQHRWLKFFKEGGQLDDAHLPDWMETAEMRQAMSILRQFSEKERDYHAYQARQNYLREQNSIQRELEEQRQGRLDAERREQEARRREQEARQHVQEANQREQEARAEIDRLKALLEQTSGKR